MPNRRDWRYPTGRPADAEQRRREQDEIRQAYGRRKADPVGAIFMLLGVLFVLWLISQALSGGF